MTDNSISKIGEAEETSNKKYFSKRELLFFILMILGIIFSTVFVIVRGDKIINSDSSAELILGKLLAENGGILSKDWYYSTELRVITSQIVYKLFFMIFPNDWSLVHILSCVVMAVIMALAAVFATRKALNVKTSFTAVALSWPFCQWYAFNVTYGLFYTAHIVFALLCIAFFYSLTFNSNGKTSKLKYTVTSILFATLSFLAGIGGVRYMLTIYCPLIIAVIVYFIIGRTDAYCKKEALDKRFYAQKIIVTFASTFFCVVGYIINKFVLSNIYHFESQSEDVWQNFSLQNILLMISESLRLLGWTSGVFMMSWQGVANLVSILFMAMLIFCVIRLFMRFKKLPDRVQFLFIFSLSAYLLNLIVLAMDRQNASYWLPILPFMFLIYDMELETEDAPFWIVNKVPVVALLSASIVLSSCNVFATPKSAEIGGEPDKTCALA